MDLPGEMLTPTTNGDSGLPTKLIDDIDELDEKEEDTGLYLPYDPDRFSMLNYYRTQNDIVAAHIVNSGMEGIDRYEISRRLGINANCKSGNRIVSSSIHSVIRTYPKLFGEFQKMEGRIRAKKYYAKTDDNAPGGKISIEYTARFKKITGRDCPFKLGDVLKFPGYNINTLRISDISLKRLVQILEYLYAMKAIITNLKLQAIIAEKEREEGYNFMIDRRSIKKLILALSKYRLINVMSLQVPEPELDRIHQVDVLTVPEINSLEDPHVKDALQKIEIEFKEQNKSFPTGHVLKKEKPDVVVEQMEEENIADEEILAHQEQAQCEEEVREDGEEVNTDGLDGKVAIGSLLDRTFLTVERLQFEQKYKPGAKSKFTVLSQKSINTLVEAAKQRRFGKNGKSRKRKTKKEPEELGEDDGNVASPASMDAATNSPSKSSRKRRSYGYATNTRLLDNVDKLSFQHKAYLRSRFTQRERDMLLLIRACSFFLNPITRFWPHPKVLRNLMHEFVPESRTKTTYSLMAAGVRELRERQAQHQYIVKTLASYRELLNLRNKLAQINLSKRPLESDDALSQKDVFFVDTFRKAYQLLFRETSDFPSIKVDDRTFRDYLADNDLHFIKVTEDKTASGNSASARSQIPQDEESVRSAIAFNAIMSIMHNESRANEEAKALAKVVEDMEKNELDASEVSDFMIGQFGIQTLASVVQQIRNNGFITKNRFLKTESVDMGEEKEPDQREDDQPRRRTVRFTNFYQHYFSSGYHRNLSRNFCSTAKEFIDEGVKRNFGNQEDPAEFIILADQLCCNGEQNFVEMTTPETLGELFVLKKDGIPNEFGEGPSTQIDSGSRKEDALNFSVNPTKQLRYLEDSELRLERFKIQPKSLGTSLISAIAGLPEPKDLQPPSERLIPANKMPSSNENGGSEPGTSAKEMPTPIYDLQPALRPLFDLIDRTGLVGISEEALKREFKNTDETFYAKLNALVESADIFVCGVDTRRYVSTRNGRAWLLVNKEGQGFVPKPWSLPSGQTNWTVLGWMLEGLFSHIFANPGLTVDDLITRFSYVLHPLLILELVEMLEKLDCCVVNTKKIHALRKTSPFTDFNIAKEVKFIQPTTNGMERVILFNNYKLSSGSQKRIIKNEEI